MAHYRSKRRSRSSRSRRSSSVKKGVSEALGFLTSGVDLLTDAAKTTIRKGANMVTMKKRKHSSRHSRRHRSHSRRRR